jgi:hypothetical protein
MVTYNCKQKNRLSLSVNYIFFINGIDSKVVAPCVCKFAVLSDTHKFWKVREKYDCRLNTTKMDGVFQRQWCLGKFGGGSQDDYNRDKI